MKIENLNLIYFSPTGTTQKILNGISEGFQTESLKNLDLTLLKNEASPLKFESNEIVVFGAPVYAGRLPEIAVKRMEHISGNQTPAAIVVLYGNREFEDALLELKHLVEKKGFIPIAAAAYIGEHSYSTEGKPIAIGRPDISDLDKARYFGFRIFEKLTEVDSSESLKAVNVPGNFPYKTVQAMSGVIPDTDSELCTQCLECVPVCPTSAISPVSPEMSDPERCIRCCACIKICPTNARQMLDPRIQQIADRLFTNFSARKEPEMFL